MALTSSECSEAVPSDPAVTVLVFAGGDAPSEIDLDRLPVADVVIAADSGADHAIRCGSAVDVIVGDLDSITERGLETARAAGAAIEPSRPDKNESDLELALLRALRYRPERIVVTAIGGGRVDHLLANLLLVCAEPFAEVDIDCYSNSTRFFVVRETRTIDVSIGQTVTLLPMHGIATGVSTVGLQYRLDREPLEPGSPRGLSNVAVASTVTVEVTAGVVLVVVPEEGNP